MGDYDLQAERSAVLAKHGVELEHQLRKGPLSPSLVACLCVLAADKPTLASMLNGEINPFKVSPNMLDIP